MRDLLAAFAVLRLGWIAWRELHARGRLTVPAPSLGLLDGVADSVADRIGAAFGGARASGDVDRIGDTLDRAIAYARAGGVTSRDIPSVLCRDYRGGKRGQSARA